MKLLWCLSHQRRADQRCGANSTRCPPGLGGIMLPCNVADLTDDVEIDTSLETCYAGILAESAPVFHVLIRLSMLKRSAELWASPGYVPGGLSHGFERWSRW
jgi:hypothetical protein